jgi:hypothetical protein
VGSRRTEHLTGFFLPYPDIGDLEEQNDGSATGSNYSEADPEPGLAVADNELSTLVPVVSGAQDDDLTLIVLRGGAPGIDFDSVHLGYRYTDDAASAVRGWQGHNGVTDWSCANYTTGADTEHPDACVHPDSQQVLVAYGDTGGGTVFTQVYDPATHTWSAGASVSGGTNGVALLALPTGRVLLICYNQTPIYRTDDFGATWTTHHEGSAGVGLERMRACYSEGEILLIGLAFATDDLYQLVSSNGGATFETIDQGGSDFINAFGTKLSCATLPDGRILVTYRRASDGLPCGRILASPWSPISDADEFTLAGAAVTDMALLVDPDGQCCVYATKGTNDQHLDAYRSPDAENWETFDYGVATVSNSNADSLVPFAAVSSCSAAVVLHHWSVNTDNHDNSIGALTCGGWEDLTYDGNQLGSRFGFGENSGTDGVCWLPIELPQNSGWTLTGTAANGTLTSARLQIATAVSRCYYEQVLGTNLTVMVRAGLRVSSNGSLANRDVAITVAVGNGVTGYRVDVKFTTTGFRVTDANGADKVDVSYDMTAEADIMIGVQSATIAVLYKRPYEATWSLANESSYTPYGVAPANGIVDFGHITVGGTATSHWRLVALLDSGTFTYSGSDTVAGRPISTIPVPLHAEVLVDGMVGRLSAIGGVGARSESYAVAAEHRRPARNIYPQGSPSPAATWRTVDKSEQVRAFEIEANRALFGEHPAVMAVAATFRTAYLERRNGAAWDIIVTLDLAAGFAGINYTLTAATLTGAAGGVAAARYLQEGELAGGYAVLETGGGAGTVAIPIRWNTAGEFSSSSSTKTARIYLEGDGITSADVNGQCDLVWPSGLAVDYQSTFLQSSRWRLRIPASQVTPYDYYEVGVLVPGVIRSPGAPHDWTKSRISEPNVRTRGTPYGTDYREEAGPPRVSLTIGWAAAGVNLESLREDTAPDYIGISGQLPIAAAEDVPWFLEGLQRFCRSGEIPIAAVLALPSADGTINDPTLWLYGRLATPVGTDQLLGNEGSNEAERPMAITIEGLV